MSNYIEPCPKCKATKGWIWVWGKNDGHSTGKSKCKGCGATFWGVNMLGKDWFRNVFGRPEWTLPTEEEQNEVIKNLKI